MTIDSGYVSLVLSVRHGDIPTPIKIPNIKCFCNHYRYVLDLFIFARREFAESKTEFAVKLVKLKKLELALPIRLRLNKAMARPRSIVPKKHVNVYISQEITDAFREISDGYAGKMGVCMTAAMLMFMESDPESRARQMTRVVEAEFRGDIPSLLTAVKQEELRRTKKK